MGSSLLKLPFLLETLFVILSFWFQSQLSTHYLTGSWSSVAVWAANKGLPTIYLQLFITTGAEKWDDTSKGFGLDFKFHIIQGFVDSPILDLDQFKKSVTNTSFHLQVSSSLTQTPNVCPKPFYSELPLRRCPLPWWQASGRIWQWHPQFTLTLLSQLPFPQWLQEDVVWASWPFCAGLHALHTPD